MIGQNQFNSSEFFSLVIFQMGPHFYAQAWLDHSHPIYASGIAGIFLLYLVCQACAITFSFFLLKKLFFFLLQTSCPGWPQTVILPISASQVARVTGMSNHV
jgi:hypothetical protein